MINVYIMNSEETFIREIRLYARHNEKLINSRLYNLLKGEKYAVGSARFQKRLYTITSDVLANAYLFLLPRHMSSC